MACNCGCNGKNKNMSYALTKLGRSQGDVGFECPDGYVWNSITGECEMRQRSEPLPPECPSGYQWHVTQGCIPSRQSPLETTPTQTPVNADYSIYGQKPQRVNICNGVIAPNGYHYIKTSNGCALAVNYDSNVIPTPSQTPNNPISNLISSFFGTGATATDSGAVADGGISGFLAQNKTLLLVAILGGGAYYLSQNKKAQPKTYDRTESYKY